MRSKIFQFITTIILLVIAAAFRLAAQPSTYSVLYAFKNVPDGANPYAGLLRDKEGNLYGTTVTGGASENGTVFKLDIFGKETILHSFSGSDGRSPISGLIMDSGGNLYGTTYYGGAYDNGAVFKLDAMGKETVLYSFTGGTDGQWPIGIVLDAAGNLYGGTQLGGAYFSGVLYKLDTNGRETVLYSFTGAGGDGAAPEAVLIRDAAGNLYGTTAYGGGAGCGGSGCGTVFKLDTMGKETVLYSFTGGADGANPDAGLVRDAAGNLYGTTPYGGVQSGCGVFPPGCGTVFKLDTTGKETILYSFTGGADGANPYFAALVQDGEGNLYGTTSAGGNLGCNAPSGCGTVFKVDTNGKETVLHRFARIDGASPYSGLVTNTETAARTYYGATYLGGSGNGVIFMLCQSDINVGCRVKDSVRPHSTPGANTSTD